MWPSGLAQNAMRCWRSITPGSPYARIARIVLIQKQLENRLEIVVAQTRTFRSP
jgi:hypothetical protein